jgi:hypothetical protein
VAERSATRAGLGDVQIPSASTHTMVCGPSLKIQPRDRISRARDASFASVPRETKRTEVEGIEAVVAGEGAVEVGGGGGAGAPDGARGGDSPDLHGGASLGGDAAGADGAGLLGEPAGSRAGRRKIVRNAFVRR